MNPARDMREFIQRLEDKGELARIQCAVGAQNFELSSMLRHEEDGPNRAILFERVKGYDMPVVANLYGSMKRQAIAWGIEATEGEIQRFRRDPHASPGSLGGQSFDAFTHSDEDRAKNILAKRKVLEAEAEASQGKYPTKRVDTAPCQEVVITENIDILGTLPVPWLCEFDNGPFITPGGLVQKDPDNGVLNIGIHRHQVGYEKYGKNKMGALLSDHSEGYRIYKRYEELGRLCEVALCLGLDPVTQVLAAYTSPHMLYSPPYSEFNIAGAVRGEPLEMVRCKTVDLEVPVNTEMVIEGVMPPYERIDEGPMAEYPDFYTQKGPLMFIEVTAITHRRNPIYQALMSGGSREHLALGWSSRMGFEQTILKKVRQLFPTAREVAYLAGSRGSHLVVSLKKRFEGEDRLLLYHLMVITYSRYLTIVDDDIDPHNSEMVEWARNTRAGANVDDFIIFPKTRTHNLDPEQGGDRLTTRMGVLATLPFGQSFTRSGPPKEILEKMRPVYEREAG